VTINIGSRGGTDLERNLSNFADTPFSLWGEDYASVEAFWQSLKFPKISDRRRVAKLTGIEAKRAGREAPKSNTLIWQGSTIQVGSPEHHQLMRIAIKAKLKQNRNILRMLLASGTEPITHILKDKEGNTLPDSRTIPGMVLSQIIMDLRKEFRHILGDGSTLID
jgi:predicted NAD-dependent protein-ADP-ribosyltransferase YbiA (DUF1768 family)